jgi:hypothetical protein
MKPDFAFIAIPIGVRRGLAATAVPEALRQRFAFLSTHGNSNCTVAFQASIATMSPMARLQGSCCAPMMLGRYASQIAGLRKYRAFPEIPPDPYDIPAGLAQRATRDARRQAVAGRSGTSRIPLRHDPSARARTMLLSVLALAGL